MEQTFRKLKLSMEDLSETYPETVGDFLLEKLHKLISLLGDLFSLFRRKSDEILPPETRAETLNRVLHVFLTVVLPVSLVLVCLYCCCCRRCGFCGCCCCFRGRGKMMRAPGRPGRYLPRSSFEADPRGYFSNLRANNDLLF